PYPDPGIRALDDSFRKYTLYSAEVERIATGFRWVEGPVWFGDGRYLLFSDIPNNQIVRWDEETGKLSVFRKPSNFSNGMTRDRQGRLITCEHSRRVTRTEYDGKITVLADSYQGKRLNSPNDVAVKSDDSIWFTDPPFGIGGNYEGYKQDMEQPHQGVYRIDGKTGELVLILADIKGPNGLAFSPDESILYLVEGRASPNRLILAFDVVENGTRLANRRTLVDADGGMADGFRVDADGNLWCGWGGSDEKNGVAVFNPQGKQIGFVKTPERISNLVFGGEKRNRLFMTGCKSVYSLFVEAIGSAPVFAK
ncbi:MAG: SMP-30/gluconolactonase/LRE family protein, partial [Planctomycetota bacterium]|nr:SMP-30/gluconolactonase/LRE family protein [Planctomycetota bacterium]